ncbi:2747_t:CDS:2 [Ambispora gerdemannii]|uniref:2747_t:CDS:1 n=1 Tax=Ambispora gerdemannii TaxID=144530 RepID=A0A9N9GS47_9GLOM|nr:2747_t:CDS:2 [Ambispora gerdemannii]
MSSQSLATNSLSLDLSELNLENTENKQIQEETVAQIQIPPKGNN